jgi:hypothetical protein
MSVVAAASMSNIQFFDEISGTLETKLRTGYFVWGVVNRAPLAEVMIKDDKVITGIPAGPTCMLYSASTCPENDWCHWNSTHCVKTTTTKTITLDDSETLYFASGWIKFNRDIPIDGTTTPVVDFEIELAKGNPYYWEYQIIGRNINKPKDFYVTRTSKNEYKITCQNVPIRTIARLAAPYYSVESVISWDFTATIQI